MGGGHTESLFDKKKTGVEGCLKSGSVAGGTSTIQQTVVHMF